MAEFKVNDSLSSEISAFGSAGEGINGGTASVSADGVSSLKTSSRFITEHNSIMQLLSLYQRLIAKEVSDLNAMVESVQTLDTNIANSIK